MTATFYVGDAIQVHDLCIFLVSFVVSCLISFPIVYALVGKTQMPCEICSVVPGFVALGKPCPDCGGGGG